MSVLSVKVANAAVVSATVKELIEADGLHDSRGLSGKREYVIRTVEHIDHSRKHQHSYDVGPGLCTSHA